jgi:hypothetical protein
VLRPHLHRHVGRRHDPADEPDHFNSNVDRKVKTEATPIRRVEVITGVERRRDWTDEQKLSSSVNPNAWLTDVLTKLVNRWPARRIDELMPWAYAVPCDEHRLRLDSFRP